jgi:hypothetical protein
LIHAFKNTGKQFANLLPIFVGVVLLVGLFNAFLSKEFLSSIFTGNALLDSTLSSCCKKVPHRGTP